MYILDNTVTNAVDIKLKLKQTVTVDNYTLRIFEKDKVQLITSNKFGGSEDERG